MNEGESFGDWRNHYFESAKLRRSFRIISQNQEGRAARLHEEKRKRQILWAAI